MEQTKDRWTPVSKIAERLDMTPNGVRDMCKRGLLVYKKRRDKGNGIMVVSEKSVESLIENMETYNENNDVKAVLLKEKEKLQEETETTARLRKDTQNDKRCLMKQAYIYRHILNFGVSGFYHTFSKCIPYRRSREILERSLECGSLDQLSDEFGLTRERIKQIVCRSHRIIIYGLRTYDEIIEENNRLRERNSRMHQVITRRERECDVLTKENEKMKYQLDIKDEKVRHVEMLPQWCQVALSARTSNCFAEVGGLHNQASIRLINCCKSGGLDTFLDVLMAGDITFQKLRNFGRQSLTLVHNMKKEFMWAHDINSSDIEKIRPYYEKFIKSK